MTTSHKDRVPEAPTRRWPLTVFGTVLALIGLALGIGGIQLITLGGSWYYLLAGIALLVSGFLIVRRRVLGAWLFGLTALATVVWALAEVGLQFWPLVPRLAPFLVLSFVLMLLLPTPVDGKARRATRVLTGLLVIINLSAASAMELYRNYLLNMGLSESDLATSYTSDEVSNVMGELMNQVVGDFTGKVRRELQTHITQNQPKMLVLNKQVQLSVDANLDNPEARRVTFYTAANNIFYLELAVDRTEFITLREFVPEAELDADAIMAAASAPIANPAATSATAATAAAATSAAVDIDADTEALLKSLGM